MTKETLAELLNGREIDSEITREEIKQAKDAGLVVVYGASDDLMEFEGAISEEMGCYDGGTACIFKNKKGWQVKSSELVEDMSDEAQENGFDLDITTHDIKAIWDTTHDSGEGDEPCSWKYETEIPHSTFRIMENGELYCVGIVFDIQSLISFEGSKKK